jgi:pimeloyl-ACP methyl ester carboxylesterase
MSFAGDDTVSPYDRLVWPEGAIEQLLASGERRRELMAYLGEAEYHALRPLATAAAHTARNPDRCVYLVPGIMGSQLSLPRERPLPDNLLWLDPIDIQQGNLEQLALPGPAIQSCGPVLYNYLPLKLALECAGYTVRYFDYDWRCDIAETGALLAARIAQEAAGDINIIGHSMGGLVARAALQSQSGARVARLITLGTPHGGSFAPTQALRGVYPLVRRIAQLDPARSAETLARDVFATFYSLYQMLPASGSSTLDLIDARNWPSTGPQPNATLLDRTRLLNLGGADRRISAIAGFGRSTVVNVTVVHDEFYYRIESAGDGTVPHARATLPGCAAWYCDVAHSELPRDTRVQSAIIRLLNDAMPALPVAAPATPTGLGMVSDTALRLTLREKINWAALDATQRRQFFDSLNESVIA